MKTRMILLLAMLLGTGQSEAWIAYGFKSGMSRFEVARNLSENHSLVVSEGAQQTWAGPDDDKNRYHLAYCSTPQRLYLMKFNLTDSPEAFIEARKKYERRYGTPEGRNSLASDRDFANWAESEILLIWHLSESETLLLSHDGSGTRAEFQDVSVCD
jgi:hypothetical protein